MKQFCILFLLAISFTCSYAQVDWKSYEEPDGTFRRLSIDPRFNFDTDYDGQFTDIDINLNSGLNYRSIKVDTFSIVNIFSNNSIAFDLSKQNDNDTRFATRIQPAFNITYDKYLNTRRGVFVRGVFDTRLSLNKRTNDDTQYNDFTSVRLGIGTGRIENISTVYQAIRINKQLNPESPLSQGELFNLADLMRTLDYNQKLDFRMENIQNYSRFLSAIKDLGYSLDGFDEIANAIDAYRFERPQVIGSGSRFLFEASVNNSFDNDFTSYGLSASHEYQKPINEKWHWANSISTNYDITNNFINLSNTTRINYFPNGRTRVSFVNNISYFDGLDQNFVSTLNYSVDVDMDYFVSPTVSVFGTFTYDFRNIGSENRYTNDLNNQIGFRKFLI